jgi:Holliday junction resolvasome RuvABC endonuclease subunit
MDASHIHGGLLGTLAARCEQESIFYEGVPIGTIKRYATGRGNAGKAAMIDAMKARGSAPADDNEADAIAVLLSATERQDGAV